MLHRLLLPASLTSLTCLAACGGDDAPPLPDGPTITAFSANPSVVMVGGTVDLSWTTNNAQSVRIFTEADGTLETSNASSGTFKSPPIVAATVFTLEASNGEQRVERSVTVEVEGPTVAPTVDTFEFSPDPVDFGAEFTVTWSVTGASTVRVELDGTEIVNGPEASGTLTRMATRVNGQLLRLEATNAAGMTIRSLPVNVRPPVGTEVEPNDNPNSATLLDPMGVATARLDTVSDVDFFEIMVSEGGWVRAETSDGMGGCQVDTTVELTDGTGTVLAGGRSGNFVLDFSGQVIGACQVIDPRISAGARELPAGVYYVRVSGGTIQNSPRVGDYTLQVTTGESGCGNGIIETGEQCDDGNTADGDACSATCTVPALSSLDSNAPSATVLSGNLDTNGSALIQLDALVASTLVAEVGNPLPGACANQMRLVLLDADLRELGDIGVIPTNGGNYPCGRIDPDRTEMLSGLPAGTYFLRTEAVNGDAVPQYGLRVRLHSGSGCGNGYRENNELCDDGNLGDNDYCRTNCTLNPLPLASAQATLDLDTQFGPFQRVRVTLPTRTNLTAAVTSAGTSTIGNCGVPTFMGLIEPTANVSVIGLSPEGVPNCGGIDQPGADYAADLEAGDYDMVALTSSPSAGGTVTVTAGSVPFGCGNGIFEASTGEQCDDGNTVDSDGCRNDCTENSVRVSEIEPNDALTSANTLSITQGGALTVVSARFGNSNDVDLFQVELSAAGRLELNTYTTEGDRRSCQTVDTVLFLLDEQGDEIANNDDAGSLCSRLVQGSLSPGRYFVAVQPFPNTAAGPYFLDILAN
ncbi:MAG: DVUA0089 family protein [Myxococcota bacterium]